LAPASSSSIVPEIVSEARPIDRRRRLAVVLVAAHEGERVAAAGIGDRDAGITRDGDSRRNPRHDLELHALLVEKQRLGAAAIEDERIAPLEPRHRFALARFFREQVTDGFLLERLRRGDADVDLLGVGARVAQQARGNDVIVQDDIRSLEILQAAYGNQSRIAWASAD
jgi:hypothetical protein